MAAGPLVIAHRGASGYRPEHTLEAYRLAIELGADVIEPDLVSTRDGVLVARHENEIGSTTDVAERAAFADRRATRVVDGRAVTGWFTEDFTLAELKTLRAIERLPRLRAASTCYDRRYEVPTLAEVVQLAQAESAARDRAISVYPETKHPAYFASIGLHLGSLLLAELARAGWDRASAPVVVQSFETPVLRWLRRASDLRLLRLVDRPPAPGAFRRLGRWVQAVGVQRDLLTPALVASAHAAGLQLHAWTLRDENCFLPPVRRRGTDPAARGDALGDHAAILDLGVDGVFCDHPDTAVEARRRWRELRRAA